MMFHEITFGKRRVDGGLFGLVVAWGFGNEFAEFLEQRNQLRVAQLIQLN